MLWIGIGCLLLAVAVGAYILDGGDFKRYQDEAARVRAAIEADAQQRIYESRIQRDKARGF